MTLVMPVSDEDTDGDEESRETQRFNNLLQKMLSLDREIILFAVLLTSYAAVRNMSQSVLKTTQPKPFFSENPWMEDFYHGEIHKAFGFARKADITFVMFYAPWDADCQRAKPIFEKVARYYHKQIHFMAINCWEPSSVCKAHFNKIKRYPVFVAYLQRSEGIEYSGIIDFAHINHFLSSIITPFQRINNLEMLKNLRSIHDAVVLAYIPFYGTFGGDEFYSFYKASMKYLELDPRRDVIFALMTDPVAGRNTFFEFFQDVPQTPTLKLFLWNSTKTFDGTWDSSTIMKWVFENVQKIATWVYPPGLKSDLLAKFINKGPVVIFFTPRNMFLSHSIEYNILKLAALRYYDCADHHSHSNEDSEDFYFSLYSLLSFLSSDDQWKTLKSLKHQCTPSQPKKEDLAHFSEQSRWANFSEKDACHHFSCESPPSGNFHHDSCSSDCYSTFQKKAPNLYYFDDDSTDPLSAKSLLHHKLKNDCRKLRFALKYLPDDWLDNEQYHLLQRKSSSSPRISACDSNSTLSFLAMDSLHSGHFAANLGVNLGDKYGRNAVFIVDSKSESVYHLNSTIISLELLENFIYNFTQNRLTRFLRSTEVSSGSAGKNLNDVLVESVTSSTFHDKVMNNNRTVLVYFYSPFCAYSQAMFHNYISLANNLKSLNEHILFVRLDGENNDLDWPFVIHKYPSIMLFPSIDKSSSKLFDHKSKITVSNLSKFVLFNLDFELRAQAHLILCSKHVLSGFNSIDGCVSDFKLSNLYFVNHYNNLLRNLLIHHKLQNDELRGGNNNSNRLNKHINYSHITRRKRAEAYQNLITNVNKIKCKLLYFQLLNLYVSNINFQTSDLNTVLSSVFNFYRIYQIDFNTISKSNSISCIKLYNSLKHLKGNFNHDKGTLKNFQMSKVRFKKILNSLVCQQKLKNASKCQNYNPTNYNKVDEEEDDTASYQLLSNFSLFTKNREKKSSSIEEAHIVGEAIPVRLDQNDLEPNSSEEMDVELDEQEQQDEHPFSDEL